jgi:hypothetical protein
MKNLLLLCACLLALAAPLRAAAAPPADIVVVRIYEGTHITAIITRGEGKSEKVEFENGVSDKWLTQSGAGYYKLFERFYAEGYVLQSTMTSGAGAYTTLLFVKDK